MPRRISTAAEAVFDTVPEANRPFSTDRRHAGCDVRQNRVPRYHGGEGGV